ncbi:hypothetical protein L3049_10720 [Labilibaculum sp. DW002]|uniref:Uncharacterized protein n=1 Tax=Paralabilibaculum antarcticum TaxID=2912572 RepID=A0ABT5VUK1_9BACT|nr:hypothetical protein [Labilibaculum sp. DW002]MDE5418482.1 hypothetical protein [Labilibaculum sp. DW002]
MIDLSNEMYITKDVYRALVDYGNFLVVDLLRKAVNLEEKEDEEGEKYYTVREEFQRLSFQDGQSQNHFFEELTQLTNSYLDDMKDSDKTALCFCLIDDEKYYNKLLKYVEEEDSDTMEQYNRKIGRELARLVCQEDKKELMEWCKEFLMDTICIFSTEFDFSLIDESTKYSLEHNLNEYKTRDFMNYPIR